MSIIQTWVAELKRVLQDEPFTVSDVRIGVFYTAAQLASRQVGVAFTPRDLTEAVCCPKSAATGPAAGTLAGQNAWELARYALSPVPLRRAVGVAVLNALSALAVDRHGTPGGRLLAGVDALESAQVRPEDQVAMVGAFAPFIKALKGHVANLWIVDRHHQALKPEELPYWRSPERAPETLGRASVVIITGSALVVGGLDALLEQASRARLVALAGPTAPLWPTPFFAQGVHVLGGLRIRDSQQMLQLVSEGGGGRSFEVAAQKVCIVRSEGPPPAPISQGCEALRRKNP